MTKKSHFRQSQPICSKQIRNSMEGNISGLVYKYRQQLQSIGKHPRTFAVEVNNTFIHDNEYFENHLNVARVYWDANQNKSAHKLNTRYFSFNDGNLSNYAPEQKIGQGAFSYVYKGVQLNSNESVVLKVLNKTREKLVNREIQILSQLNGTSDHIVQLLDAIRSKDQTNATLIFKYLESHSFSHEVLKMEIEDVKFYLYQLLIALDVTHKNGVMHRDVKLSNTIVDKSHQQLILIDWGLSEFYRPKQQYSTKAGTRRYYKAPELLVNYRYYDYSIDVWSFGCILGQLIFRKHPLFKGKDNQNQLVKITKVLGTDELYQFLDKYNVILNEELQAQITYHKKKPWHRFINQKNYYFCTDEALDLLSKILVYDHKQRLTAKEAMAHPYFKSASAKYSQLFEKTQ